MNKNKIFWGIFTLIIISAIFLRTWNHHDWLFFKWDQGRDSMLLAKAVNNGPGDLPLLGPRATKVDQDYLHLGPAYYYFEYLPAVILGSTDPAAFAYFDLIMSILTIPLLFVFCRLYFSSKHSLIITGLYSISFLIVQYSRFAWNPNSVPFLMLLTFYGMLRFAQSEKLKEQIKWLALWAFGFSMASQFHFYAFFALIGICGIFFLYHLSFSCLASLFIKTSSTHFAYQFSKLLSLLSFSSNLAQKRKAYQAQTKKLLENIKKAFTKNILLSFGVALLVIIITYTPMIVSELKTDFNNSKNFLGAFSEKARDDKTFNEKIIRNFREQAKAYFLITTSFEHRSGNKADPIPINFGLFLMIIGIILPIYFYRKEKNQTKKNFLFLIPIWISFFFLLTITTSYGLRPRYFVPVFPMPFLIIGLFLIWLDIKYPKKALFLTSFIVLTILSLNLYGIKQWFTETKLSQNQAVPTKRNLILQKDDGITLGQFQRAVDYIIKNSEGDHVLIWTKAEYKGPLKYLLKQKKSKVDWDFVSKEKELYQQKNMFAVNTVAGGYQSISKNIKKYTKITTEKQFGQIIVFNLKVDSTNIPAPQPKEPELNIESSKTERLFWKDVF